MSHNVETMAYAGETPWHGLGKKVHADLTPEQFLVEAGLDWRVEKRPSYFENKEGVFVPNGTFTLVRDIDDKVLTDGVGRDWHPTQNHEMAGFFHDFVMDNEISIETGGSLQDGKIVWFLGKTKRAFSLKFNGGEDLVENYLLFSLYHKFGFASDIRNTDIRVVCNNTFSEAHGKEATHNVKFDHRQAFNVEEAKLTLAASYEAQRKYREKAEFLSTKYIGGADPLDYFQDLFPTASKKKEYSRNALLCNSVMETQPGAELGEGTWWQAFNAVTYAIDHKIGKIEDNSTQVRAERLQSSWYGHNRKTKTDALELALGYAAM